jgi:hypothetical protein
VRRLGEAAVAVALGGPAANAGDRRELQAIRAPSHPRACGRRQASCFGLPPEDDVATVSYGPKESLLTGSGCRMLKDALPCGVRKSRRHSWEAHPFTNDNHPWHGRLTAYLSCRCEHGWIIQPSSQDDGDALCWIAIHNP